LPDATRPIAGPSQRGPVTIDAASGAVGLPVFSEQLHVGRPNIGDRRQLFRRMQAVLNSRWLTNDGPYVREFERRVEDFIGVRHCVATGNATVALQILARALDLQGEVIVPSFTFIATAHALQWQHITPVFCDIDPDTWTVDPARVQDAITDRTTAIMGVHVFGRPCNVDALTELAARHGLKLLFDAAHAFGCSYRGRMIGGFGDAEVFSFHATKIVNSLEGGAVVTDDDELAGRVRLMRNFGFSAYDRVDELGINGKMNEISAVVGLTNLEAVGDFVRTNRDNYEQYHAQLDRAPGITLMEYDGSERNNYQYVVIEVDETATGLSRDDLQASLWAENVLARRYFHPGCHRSEPYRSQSGGVPVLPVTESVSEHVLALPTGAAVGRREVSEICHIIRGAVENSRLSATSPLMDSPARA
jgi:dTDP-4-amino-4,6-dideoxygalactose transaminase